MVAVDGRSGDLRGDESNMAVLDPGNESGRAEGLVLVSPERAHSPADSISDMDEQRSTLARGFIDNRPSHSLRQHLA